MSTTKPQPSPGQNPAERSSNTRISSAASAPGLGEAHHFERVEAQIHAAGEGHVEIARDEGRTGVGDGQQRAGAGAVHRVAAALQIELIADAPGDGVGESAGERFLADRRERGFVFSSRSVEKFLALFRRPVLFCERGVQPRAGRKASAGAACSRGKIRR